MKKLHIYQVDAFANTIFSGNPAAVVPLEEWLTDGQMQKIAAENNLAETAFFVKKEEDYHIRWFTPLAEVDLCGHATLAAAYVVFNLTGYEGNILRFDSRSGMLTVSKNEHLFTLNFPADQPEIVAISTEMKECFSKSAIEAYQGSSDYMMVFASQSDIEQLVPDLLRIANLPVRGVIVTAKGDHCDFVSRFFGPAVGVNEDSVTGSAHTLLTPYWSKVLEKEELKAEQLSARGGKLHCKMLGDRVEISGNAALYMSGEIYLPSEDLND